jgi:hypothetical protein
MCEIDITRFVQEADPFEFSASRAERGEHAGRDTWRNAVAEGTSAPLLTTEEHFDALRAWAKDTGAWDAAERAAWSEAECNALFIQLVSGDMREAGMGDCELDEFDWDKYQSRASEGRISGNIYRCDIEGHESFGRIFYYLGS